MPIKVHVANILQIRNKIVGLPNMKVQ